MVVALWLCSTVVLLLLLATTALAVGVVAVVVKDVKHEGQLLLLCGGSCGADGSVGGDWVAAS